MDCNQRHKHTIRTVIMRGGTSRGVFFLQDDLPQPSSSSSSGSESANVLRDAILCDVMGSPDVRQIDGLGGADVLTSKVAIVSTSSRSDADVDYLFGQVEFGGDATNGNGRVSWDVNCGNISAAVGPFAIDEGLLLPLVDGNGIGNGGTLGGDTNNNNNDNDTEEEVDLNTGDDGGVVIHRTVRIYNVNTQRVIIATVPVDVRTGRSVTDMGGYSIDGVPGTAARIDLDFSKCVGTINGRILPTGNRMDVVEIEEESEEIDDDDNNNNNNNDRPLYRSYEISFVDVANPVVHINGLQLGLKGDESATDIINNVTLWTKVAKIRHAAARLVMSEEDITSTKPFTAVVLPALYDYMTLQGGTVQKDTMDVRSHVWFCDSPHKAYPGTASNATAAAAMIHGTVVHDMVLMARADQMGGMVWKSREEDGIVSIGHPSGHLHVEIELEDDPDNDNNNNNRDVGPVLKKSIIGRTARRIMEGNVYLKPSTVERMKKNAVERPTLQKMNTEALALSLLDAHHHLITEVSNVAPISYYYCNKLNQNDLQDTILHLRVLNVTLGTKTSTVKVQSYSHDVANRKRITRDISYNRIWLCADLAAPPNCFVIVTRTANDSKQLLQKAHGETFIGSEYFIHEPDLTYQSIGSIPCLSGAKHTVLLPGSSQNVILSTESIMAEPTSSSTGEPYYFALTGKPIRLHRVKVVRNDPCIGIQCDRQESIGKCTCLDSSSPISAFVFSFDVTFPVPSKFHPEGMVTVHNYRSLRTSRLFFVDSISYSYLANERYASHMNHRQGISDMVEFINENGGWTIAGWYGKGLPAHACSENGTIVTDNVQIHISFLFPTRYADNIENKQAFIDLQFPHV